MLNRALTDRGFFAVPGPRGQRSARTPAGRVAAPPAKPLAKAERLSAQGLIAGIRSRFPP